MADLWHDTECAGWHAALSDYDAVIERQGVRKLAENDRWYREEMPEILRQRGDAANGEPPFVTRDELVRVTRWKMERGEWRARNLVLVEGNDAAAVERVSREAFAAVPDPRRPIALLASLAGVGPATASAVLAAGAPDSYPFFDDLIARQIPDLGEVKFTIPYYLRYADCLRQRAAGLTAGCLHAAWSPHAVGQALWAASGGKAALGKT